MGKVFNAQQRIADLCNADAYFNTATNPYTATVQVITQRKRNIANEVQQRLVQIGAGVIVMLPLWVWEGESDRRTLGLKFGIIVSENPIVNETSPSGSGKPAEDIVENLIRVIHWQPNAPGVPPRNVSSLYRIDKNAVRLMETRPGMPPLSYIVSVNTSITI